MPRTYKRISNRGSWYKEDLIKAMDMIKEQKTTAWEAAKTYNIPYRTLNRHLKNQSRECKLGPSGCLEKYEDELVAYIKQLEKSGFPPTSQCVRRIAYSFALKNNIKNRFNETTKIAGYDWFRLFMKRHPDLSVRKAQGVSIARGLGMNRTEVDSYFQLLKGIYTKYDLNVKPANIYNMDETGLQMNNEAGKVVATKGVKDVHLLTSSEKGETISVITCCNAEGQFLPPYCLMKGKRFRSEFEDGMPPGSTVKMNAKSAYVNAEIFFDWLKNHFLPRKSSGKVLLILDGHSSHCSDVNTLDFAAENDIILLCLPSHTTHYLQPLDRSFFKSLKCFWKGAVTNWLFNHPGRRVTRYQFGELLNVAWSKAATTSNGVNGFKACGILPFDPQIIPEHAFSISDSANEFSQNAATNVTNDQANQTSSDEAENEVSFQDIIPVPQLVQPKPSARKQHAKVLNKTENLEIARKKNKEKENKKASKRKACDSKTTIPAQKKIKRKRIKSNTSDDISDEETCSSCKLSYYSKNGPKCDWVQCGQCKKWMHEDCCKSGICPVCHG